MTGTPEISNNTMDSLGTEPSRASLPRLPEELLLEIAGHLPSTRDLTNFRLVCRDLCGPALEKLTGQMNIIFVENTPASLKRLTDIANSPPHAAGITRIIFILRPPIPSRASLSRNKKFLSMVRHYRVPRRIGAELLDEMAALHEHQQASLRNNDFRDAISLGMAKFDNLQQIHVQHRPLFSAQGEPFLPQFSVGPNNVYNLDKSWYGNALMDHFMHRSERSFGECAENDLRWLFQYDINPTGGVRDLKILLQALAGQNAGSPPRSFELGFLHCDLDAVGRHMSRIDDRSPELLQAALQHITHFRLAPLLDFASSHHIDGTLPLSDRARDGWYTTMQHMKRLNVLDIECATVEHTDTALRILNCCTFRSLKTLRLECHGEWNLMTSEQTIVLQPIEHLSVPTTVLMPFIGRHASTLQVLELRSALGVDGTTLVRSPTVLRDQLGQIKSQCKHLKLAYIRERSTSVATMEDLDSSDSFSIWTYQAMRMLERESQLGHIARDLGADAAEVNPWLQRRMVLQHGVERSDENGSTVPSVAIDTRDPTEVLPESFPEVAAVLRKSLAFIYDFGPSILEGYSSDSRTQDRMILSVPGRKMHVAVLQAVDAN